jgi:hypothetical protein
MVVVRERPLLLLLLLRREGSESVDGVVEHAGLEAQSDLAGRHAESAEMAENMQHATREARRRILVMLVTVKRV